MSVPYLFVYGTLLSGTEGVAAELLAETADLLGPASCQGRLYRVNRYPGMIGSPLKRDRVTGQLFRLRNPVRTLTQLDQYEGCCPGLRKPTEFVRRLHRVTPESGQSVMAWAYLYNLPVHSLRRIASGNFLAEPVR